MIEKNWNDNYDADFSELVGKTLVKITGGIGDDTVQFETSDGQTYQLHYYSDCCASCDVEDVCGDLSDLIGYPVLLAEEVSSSENPSDVKPETIEYQDSFTWTFYKLATIKGSVTIRWYGSSNGYYSERATFERIGQ